LARTVALRDAERGPARSSDEYDGVGIMGAAHRNDLVSVRADAAPAHIGSYWFVRDLVENCALVTVLLSDGGEGRLGAVDVVPGVARREHVPVGDDVHAACVGLLDEGVHEVRVVRGIRLV